MKILLRNSIILLVIIFYFSFLKQSNSQDLDGKKLDKIYIEIETRVVGLFDPEACDVSMIETATKRDLQTSATSSTVIPSSITTIEPYKQYTIIVYARDSSGNLVGTGGDNFFVRFSNECTHTDTIT